MKIKKKDWWYLITFEDTFAIFTKVRINLSLSRI